MKPCPSLRTLRSLARRAWPGATPCVDVWWGHHDVYLAASHHEQQGQGVTILGCPGERAARFALEAALRAVIAARSET